MSPHAVALTVLLLSVVTCQGAQYSCKEGCSLQLQPVCAADGNTYTNECTALCQGLTVASTGRCPGDKLQLLPMGYVKESTEQQPRFSEDDMFRFADDGYRLVGRLKDVPHVMPPEHHDSTAQGFSLVAPGQVLTLLRVTPGGLAYKSQVTVPDGASSTLQELLPSAADPDKIAAALAALAQRAADASAPSDHDASPRLPDGTAPTTDKVGAGSSSASPSASPSTKHGASSALSKMWSWLSDFYSPDKAGTREAAAADAEAVRQHTDSSSSSSSRPGGRRLQLVMGTDDRTTCPIEYPYTATGEMIGIDGSGNYVCTGTLFKSDRVLTAAHCVYDYNRAAFSKALNFAPGRAVASNGTVLSPFGVHNWVYATFLAGYLNSNGTDYDMAVVKLASSVGDTVGWLGLRPSNCSQQQQRGNVTLTMSGYPGDMPDGSCWSDTCSVRLPVCSSTRLEHQCDTYPGQSGAGMWQMDGNTTDRPYIRAVHVRGYNSYNEATLITREIFNEVSTW